MSANQWAKIISEAHSNKIDVVPDGWNTIKQIAEQTKAPIKTTHTKIMQLVKDGKVEMKKFRVTQETYARLTPHYKIK